MKLLLHTLCTLWVTCSCLCTVSNDAASRGPVIKGTASEIDEARLDVPEHLLAVSYNQGEDFIYIFGGLLSSNIYRFDLRTNTTTIVGQNYIARGSVTSNGGSEIFLFGGLSGTIRNQIWLWNSSDPGDLEQVGTLPAACEYPTSVWNPDRDEAYVFGGEAGAARFDTVVKFELGIPTATVIASMSGRSRAAAIWDDNMNVAYIFGGEVAPLIRSPEILKFDPSGGDAILLDTPLPGGMEWPCAVWTGQEALIIGTNHPAAAPGTERVDSNIVLFVPGNEDGSEQVIEIVVDNLPSMYAVGCAYVAQTDGIYIFGGVVTGDYSSAVMYIQLHRDESTTTTPSEPATTFSTESTTGVATSSEPTTTELDPSTTEPEPTTTEADFTTTEQEQSTTEPDPSTTQSEPSTTESDATTTEAPASTTESDPTTTEPELTTTEQDPSSSTTEESTTPLDPTEGSSTTDEPSSPDPTTESIPPTTEPASTPSLDPVTTEGSTTTGTPPEPTTEPVTPTQDPPSPTTDPTTTTTVIVDPPPSPTTEKETPTPEPPTTTTTTTTEATTTVDPTNPAACSATDNYGTRYEATAGNTARARCPGLRSTGTATWFCTRTGRFDGDQPNYSNCTNGWLPGLDDEVPETPIDSSTAAELLDWLKQNVTLAASYENDVTYFGHEIRLIFQVGQRILEVAALDTGTSLGTREKLTSTNLEVYSKVLDFEDPWGQLSGREKAETATAFIMSTDVSAITLATPTQQSRAGPIGYRKPFHDNSDFRVLAGSEDTLSRNRITFSQEYNPKLDSYMEIPESWANGFSRGEVVPFSGVQLVSTRANFLFTPPVPAEVAGRILNGPLMSFTFDEGHDRGHAMAPRLNFSAGTGVRITIQHDIWAWSDKPAQIRRKLHSDQGERSKGVSGTTNCSFWDPVALEWSTNGCKVVSSDRDTTVCECDHLTSFAVIMDLHDYIGQDTALTIITLILCPLSTLCLLLYILVFIYHRRKQRLMSNHPRNELTFGICVSLFFANMLILVTMDKNYLYLSDEVCIGSAIALHYALLCAFAWMALEGILLARLVLVDVFSSGREHTRIERLAAFLVPAVIVGATCAVNFTRGDNGYGNDSFCWLNGAYLWSFIGPMAAVVLFNAVVLTMSIRQSHLLKNQPNLKVQRRASTIGIWLQGSLNLTAIMGITWAFGFLMLFDNSEIAHFAAYAFTLFNASQGIFIFAFHVAANKQIQRKFSIFTTKSTAASASTGEFRSSDSRNKSSRKSGRDPRTTK